MAIKFNLKAQKIFLGDREVIRVYKGNKKVYEKAGEPQPLERYVQVSSADFDSYGNYRGTEEYIILPADKTSGYKITNSNVKGVATDGDYLTDASRMFYGHTGLDLELDYLDTSKVTDMYCMFNASRATTIDVSNFNTSNVTNMERMFYNSQATTLDLSNFDTSNVTTMYAMFSGSQATTLDLSSFNTSNVTRMERMFKDSQATTGYARTQTDARRFNSSTDKPSGLTFVVEGGEPPVTTYTVTFVDHDDTLIKEELVEEGSSATAPTNPTREGYTFDGWDVAFDNVTSNLTVKAIYIAAIPGRYVQVSSADFDSNGNYTGTEQYIILPEDKTSGYKITKSNVKGVATKGAYLTDASNMFYGHTGLYLELDYLDTSNVTDMSYMFFYSKATTLDVSSFDTSNVTNMRYMFDFSQATTLDLSNFVTSNVTDMGYMFYSSKATTLDLSSFDTSNVTTMDHMFAGSKATTLDLSSFDTSKVTNMYGMFTGSQATTGYARTQGEARKFNRSSDIPSGLTFWVK